MKGLRLLVTLGLAHAAADASTGFLLTHFARSSASLPQTARLLLLYNVLAFGAQPLAGLLADRLRSPRAAALAGLSLISSALLLAFTGQSALACVIVAGVGSAAFHVGGGALALSATKARASGAGIFTAPGVVGLVAGGALALSGQAFIWPLLVALLLALTSLLAIQRIHELPYAANDARQAEDSLVGREFVLLALLAAIALRSAAWTTIQFVLHGHVSVLLSLALAAFAGKLFGGLLADKLGWRRTTASSLALAAVLLTFANENFAALLFGVALLQSATPAMLAALAQILPQRPATAAGLALGLAVALGGLPLLGHAQTHFDTLMLSVLALAAALLTFGWKFSRQARREEPDEAVSNQAAAFMNL